MPCPPLIEPVSRLFQRGALIAALAAAAMAGATIWEGVSFYQSFNNRKMFPPHSCVQRRRIFGRRVRTRTGFEQTRHNTNMPPVRGASERRGIFSSGIDMGTER